MRELLKRIESETDSVLLAAKIREGKNAGVETFSKVLQQEAERRKNSRFRRFMFWKPRRLSFTAEDYGALASFLVKNAPLTPRDQPYRHTERFHGEKTHHNVVATALIEEMTSLVEEKYQPGIRSFLRYAYLGPREEKIDVLSEKITGVCGSREKAIEVLGRLRDYYAELDRKSTELAERKDFGLLDRKARVAAEKMQIDTSRSYIRHLFADAATKIHGYTEMILDCLERQK